MPLYATVNGQQERATKDGARSAECPDCAAPMLAKTGDIKIWHWAHRTEPINCTIGYETVWHLEWKDLGIPGTQEIRQGSRRADILAPGGWAVEFQASPLSNAEITSRENDWDWWLIWVFDAREAYTKRRIITWDKQSGEPTYIRWAHAPERIRAARCPAILDFGNELFHVERWYPDSHPLTGHGWHVSREWVISHVLHGTHWRLFPPRCTAHSHWPHDTWRCTVHGCPGSVPA